MSRSRILMTIVNGVSAGSKFNNREFGGVYFPAHMKNGRKVEARFEVTVFANLRGYTDANGNATERQRTYRIVGWNSENAQPGRGLADIMAKTISIGKTLTMINISDVRNYDHKLMLNGQPAINPATGEVITYPTYSFKVAEAPLLGNDAAKTIATEVAAWNGQLSFFSRPPQWNVPGTQDYNIWQQLCKARMDTVYDGVSETFGFARVVVPEGAQVITGTAGAGTTVGTGTGGATVGVGTSGAAGTTVGVGTPGAVGATVGVGTTGAAGATVGVGTPATGGATTGQAPAIGATVGTGIGDAPAAGTAECPI